MRKFNFMLLMLASVFTMGLCSSNNDDPVSTNPFDNITESSNKERDKIVIISDLHLGNDLTYSENVKHLKRLEEFLGEVRSSGTVKELVIGGDMFDEWYIPTRSETYPNGSQADFIKKSVKANQGVFDLLNGIIKDGKIKLTYVRGITTWVLLPKMLTWHYPE